MGANQHKSAQSAQHSMLDAQYQLLRGWEETLAERQAALDRKGAALALEIKANNALLATRRQELGNRERAFFDAKKAASATDAKLFACAWLLEKGCDVFRNVSGHGLVDIVAIQGANVFFFDVKSVGTNKPDSSRILSEEQSALGVLALWVEPDGSCHVDVVNNRGRRR